MIHLQRTRFGDIDLEDTAQIRFPRGVIGFSDETSFAILERERGHVAFLQSIKNHKLALPVIDASLIRPEYPAQPRDEIAALAGIDPKHLLVLVVVSVNPKEKLLRANLLAPILIDAERRLGWQVILDPEKYGADVVVGGPRNKSAPAPGSEAEAAM